METIIERCCGIDVYKKTMVACLMVGTADKKPHKTIKTFSSMTRDLLVCKDWLESEGCTCVAMESSGVSPELGDAVTASLSQLLNSVC